MTPFEFNPIGKIHSCFKEKFGTPRQSGIVNEARATLVFEPEFSRVDAVRELEAFSHVWVVFVFDRVNEGPWEALVRPPRLGGNRKVGVFASRSPFRPNPIGLSVVKLDRVEITGTGPVLHLSGVDMVDGTPVLDIKPYIPYADSIPDALGGFAPDAPKTVLRVEFSAGAEQQAATGEKRYADLKQLIVHMLEQDPRPAYKADTQTDPERTYGIRLLDWDVKWQVKGDVIRVLSLD